jgi:hypothetical protein
MKFVWDKKFSRYMVYVEGELAGFVFGKTGLWRAFSSSRQHVREGRTRAIAAERMLIASGKLRRPA